jgi:hypothetical protein
MPLDDEDLQEELGTTNQTGFTSSRGQNPYTTQLQELLGKYLEQTDKQATEKQAILDKARERILSRQSGPSDAETAFRIAGAFGKPTRTGSFFESLGGVSDVTADVLSQKRKSKAELEDLQMKYDLASIDQKGDGLKTKVSALSTLAKTVPKDRLTEIEKLTEVIQDPKASPDAKRIAEARIKKLTFIKSDGAGAGGVSDKPQSPAGKIAADEGFKPGTPEFNARVKQIVTTGTSTKLSAAEIKIKDELQDKVEAGKEVVSAFGQALKLNDTAYEGRTAGVRESIGSVIPGVRQSEAQTATADLENIVLGTALTQLKAIFGAAPTEGERKILIDVQGSINKPAATRKAIWERAQKAAARRVTENQKRLTEISSGAYARQAVSGENDGGEEKADGGRVGFSDGGGVFEIHPLVQKGIDEGRIDPRDAKWMSEYARTPGNAQVETGKKYPDMSQKMENYMDRIKSGQATGEGFKENKLEIRGGSGSRSGGGGGGGGIPKSNRDLTRNYRDGGDVSAANIGRAIGQGLGFGFGDEAIARVRAKMENRPYEDVLREEREAYDRFVEKNPLIALGTEVVSGAIPSVAAAFIPGGQAATAVGATRTAQAAQRLASVLPKVLKGPTARMAGTAGVQGSISGAGTATEGERGSGAIQGGLTSAVAGPVIAKTSQLVGAGGKAIKSKIAPSPKTVEARANEKVLEAMARDEIDPVQARTMMEKDRAMGVNSTLMDVTPSTKTLGEAVVTVPGSGRKILGQALEDRLEGGRDVVGQRVVKDLAKGRDYVASEDSLLGKLRANANNLYETAYAHGAVDDPRLMKVLEDDTFKSAFKEAQRIAGKEARAAELRGEDPSKFILKDIYDLDDAGELIKVGKVPDVRTLDYIKRGIDALIDKGYKGEGMGKAEANALKDLRKAYIGAIDENVPEYAAARAKYAGDMEVLDALRLGREEFMSPKTLPEQAKKIVANMSEGERDALRTGATQAILTKIMDSPQQINAAQRVIGAPATRKRLEALFDNPQEYEIFEAALKRESELFRNAQDIARGSRTQPKAEAVKDLKSGSGVLDVAGEAVDVAMGTPGSVVGRVLKYLQARTTLDEQSSAEIAKMLKSSTPQEIDDTLSRLERSSAKFIQDKERTSKRLQGIAGTTGRVLPESEKIATEKEEAPEEDVDAMIKRLSQE